MTPDLPAWLRAYPGVVVGVSADGVVAASNGVLERLRGRPVLGEPLGQLLDRRSCERWGRLHRGEEPVLPGASVELALQSREWIEVRAFTLVREQEPVPGATWLVERPRDERVDRLHREVIEANSELVNLQRELSKEKARLARALVEVERHLAEKHALSEQLQAQNEEVEAQNEQLMAATEQLVAGQEELEELNRVLTLRSAELEEAMLSRNRFYAAMSHELRTPLNAILGYNDLLLAGVYGTVTEEQRGAVQGAQRAAGHLRELVNDVLDISKIEADKLELQPERVDLGMLLLDLSATVRPLADQAGSELVIDTGDDLPLLTTDPRRVRQILLNLIANAIKFGEGKPIHVRSRVEDQWLVVDVRDEGLGIAAEDQPRIFEEFVQLGAGPQGTGLGLPISLRLAELLGGELSVRSDPGEGSTFRLALPLDSP